MNPLAIRQVLVHFLPYKLNEHAWLPSAVIEDPVGGEVAFVTLDTTVETEHKANVDVLVEASALIRQDRWRVDVTRSSMLLR